MPADLIPEPIAQAVERADRTLHFEAQNGRENGPYDLEGFAIRRGPDLIPPIGLSVAGTAMIATFALPIQPTDEVPE